MDVAIITFGIGAIIFSAYLFTHIFHRFNIPDVLFLVLIGLILGPIAGFVDVDNIGVLGELFATLTVLIILFEAGLGLRMRELFSSAPRALLLMLLTLISTVLVVVPVAHFLLNIPFVEALLAGVLLGGISSGIVIPVISKLPLKESTKSLLTLESNLNDVVTIAIVFAIIDFASVGVFDVRTFSASLGTDIFIALLVGSIGALLWSQVIHKVRGIQNNVFMTPALVLVLFGVSELLGASGIFAALAFGITLGNLQFFDFQKLPRFVQFETFSLTKWERRAFENFVFLFKTYFFIYIGLSIGLEDMWILAIAAGVTLLLFGMRYLAVNLAAGSSVSGIDRQVLYRLLPKGLVGAALITLVSNEVTRDFTYGVILFSILLTSMFIFLLPQRQTKQVHEQDEGLDVQPATGNREEVNPHATG